MSGHTITIQARDPPRTETVNLAVLQLELWVAGDDRAKIKEALEEYPLLLENSDCLHYILGMPGDSVHALRYCLEDLGFDPSHVNSDGNTLFGLCSNRDKHECAKVLIRDPRANLNGINRWQRTPLFYIIWDNSVRTLEYWLASGREMSLVAGRDGFKVFSEPLDRRIQTYDLVKMAGELKRTEIRNLLADHIVDPDGTKLQCRGKFGSEFTDDLAAEAFALTVFLCDGLLAVNKGDVVTEPSGDGQTTNTTRRFFCMISRLPMELQMIVCYRYAGHGDRINIPASKRELGMRWLGRQLTA